MKQVCSGIGRVMIMLLLAGGCGSESATPSPDGGGIDVASLTYKPCDQATYAGGVIVELDDTFTGVQAQVFDAPNPARFVDTLQSVGECRWVKSPARVCDPSCAVGQTCGLDNTCVATPIAQDVGTITIEGMAADVTMPPRAPAYFYNFTGTLPHPGFAAGAGLRATVDGTALLGWGIEALAGVPATLNVAADQPLVVQWTAPASAGPARIELSVNVNGHGLVGSHVECVVADTGSYSIPASLVSALLDDGTSGFPTLTVRRTTTDSAARGATCIEFDVRDEAVVDLIIPGVISCNSNDDCTAPATCQTDLTCR